ncbi:hypothetical protein KIW84_035650 [Lathyrus oleraceus]|uniref:Uncharacterized protein n=1 Tax=Pisum sativum TaxID=3888 RepID=A0A9D5B102_PEA|nr:hypothetical protein KIW84_035650 [Pisum sativum]
MDPKRQVVAKKPKSEEGASRGQVHFNAIRCLGNLQELRFRDLSNRRIWLRSHTSIPVESSYFLYYLVDDKEFDVAQIIANEIKVISENGTKLGSKPNCALPFPGLIIELSKKAKILIPNQNGGPQEGSFQFMNPEASQSHITWLGDKPIFLEGTHLVAVEAEQGEVEERIEEYKGEG